MASTNGILSPGRHSESNGSSFNVHGKRKREPSTAAEIINGTADSTHYQRSHRNPQQQISDFIEVLKSYDTESSVLNHEMPARAASAEPQAKRKKSDATAETSTILDRASSGSYSNLEEVVSDVKVAAAAVFKELHLPGSTARTQYTPIPIEVSEMASRILAFQKKAEEILEIEEALNDPELSEKTEKEKISQESKAGTNGSATTQPPSVQIPTGSGDQRLVLTLYGNAPQAKQLFSSLQVPMQTRDGQADVILPLREAGLPYGIGTTRIMSVTSSSPAEVKKRVPTIGELFSTQSPTLQPAKQFRTASVRSNVIGWYQPSATDSIQGQSNQSYYVQKIKPGQWLDYIGASGSMDAKRRQRERALSLSGIKTSTAVADTAAQEASKLDALFRSAYSGFSPSRDDTGTIIPEGVLNRLWWRKAGEKSFERLVRHAADVEKIITTDPKATSNGESGMTISDKELEELEQAIQHWDEQVIDPNLEDSTSESTAIVDKDVEEILQGISELLETLNSYQRIRNLTISPVVRPALGPSVPEQVGTPSKPSESEVATYNTLKAQLSLMITMLPPYAVAKLNSDQLSELNVSAKIQVLTESHKGVMMEDEAATRAKVAEMRAATGARSTTPAAATAHRSSTALYGDQYASSPRRPSIPGGQQYFGVSQTPIRAPPNLQRQPPTAPMLYGGVRPASSTGYQGQAGYGTPTYAHQLPRTSQSQYGQSPSQQYFRNPSQTFPQTQGQSYSTPSMTGQRYQSSNQTAHQQNTSRPQALPNGLDYRYNASSGRQGSPQKPQAYSPQTQASQLQNRSFATATPSLSQGRQYFPAQALTNGSGSISPQPQVAQQGFQNHLGATGYQTVLTAEQQSNMIERHRAQLAQQQGTQQQARSAAQAGAISVSPAPQVNGGGLTAGH